MLFLVAAAAATSWFGFFYFRDNFSTHYPIKALSAAAFRSGEIPYWNFQLAGGQPLAGNSNTLTFYPLNVLYLFLPVHVAFNLHFLLHVAAGVAAMRALCRARGISPRAASFAALVYALSGVVVSATCFYNLIIAVAMVPLALLAVERRSAPLLGAAFGLLLLGAEPVTIAGAGIAVAIAAWRRVPILTIVKAVFLALVIASPQLLAFWEIAGDVERTGGMPAEVVLNHSLSPLRIAEIFVWPFSGVLNEAGGADRARLFSTIFIGIIAIPALVRRSRYVAIALVTLFLASANPIVTAAVAQVDWLRFGRYPEKFVIPLTVALVVLIGEYYDRTRARGAWLVITLVPLLWTAARALPIDWFAHYALAQTAPRRVFVRPDTHDGERATRLEYRERARTLDPLFGMPAGVGYLMLPSPDGIQSRLTHVVVSRFHTVPNALQLRYLQLAGAAVPGALPGVMVVPRTIAAPSLHDAVALVESPSFDPRAAAVAPMAFVSAPGRVTASERRGQTITFDIVARGPVLVMVNQTYFGSWVATLEGNELPTVSLNIDRLGVLVPQSGRVILRFGRYRVAVAAAAAMSFLLLIAVFTAELIEKRDGSAGEVERSGDHDAALGRVEGGSKGVVGIGDGQRGLK